MSGFGGATVGSAVRSCRIADRSGFGSGCCADGRRVDPINPDCRGHWPPVYTRPAMPVAVSVANEATEEMVDAFAKLIPQLSSSNPPPTLAELAAIVANEASHLLIARDVATNTILGSLTLVVFPIPTAIRAWIEDVVVDTDARGSGAGAALNTEAIKLAGQLGAKTVDLTSRPSREAANRLYQRLGFELRVTNCYRYTIV